MQIINIPSGVYNTAELGALIRKIRAHMEGVEIVAVPQDQAGIDELVHSLSALRDSDMPTVVIGAGHDGRVSGAWAKQMREFAAACTIQPDTIELHPDTFRRLVKGPQRQRAQWKDERNRKYRR